MDGMGITGSYDAFSMPSLRPQSSLSGDGDGDKATLGVSQELNLSGTLGNDKGSVGLDLGARSAIALTDPSGPVLGSSPYTAAAVLVATPSSPAVASGPADIPTSATPSTSHDSVTHPATETKATEPAGVATPYSGKVFNLVQGLTASGNDVDPNQTLLAPDGTERNFGHKPGRDGSLFKQDGQGHVVWADNNKKVSASQFNAMPKSEQEKVLATADIPAADLSQVSQKVAAAAPAVMDEAKAHAWAERYKASLSGSPVPQAMQGVIDKIEDGHKPAGPQSPTHTPPVASTPPPAPSTAPAPTSGTHNIHHDPAPAPSTGHGPFANWRSNVRSDVNVSPEQAAVLDKEATMPRQWTSSLPLPSDGQKDFDRKVSEIQYNRQHGWEPATGKESQGSHGTQSKSQVNWSLFKR